MNLGSTMFISHLKSIDLHGYDRDSARVAINDFIKENVKLKNKEFVIIHGIGTGILKNTTHETLKKNNTELILTNNSLTEAINVLQNDFSRGLEAIEKMSEKTQKEVHYVTKIKTQLVRDKNASCIDTTNAIYNRLWEQADSNSSATSGKIGS